MPSLGSVSQWILGLKEGEAEAVQRLWERYSAQLLALAKARMQFKSGRIVDEEDIALDVFQCLCTGAADGRFKEVRDRDDLWWLLLRMTKHKVIDHIRRERAQKRGAHGRMSEDGIETQVLVGHGFALEQLICEEPTAEFVVMLAEEHQRLFALLRDDRLRQVASSRIEGYSVSEIASDLAVSVRSVERKLQLIRRAWANELDNVR